MRPTEYATFPRFGYHSRYHSSGHVWQGRFKAFPMQADDHYCTVLRYVERNPLRANMVKRSQDGEWSSLLPNARSGPDGLLCEGPLPKHSQWTRFVNGAETQAELKALRHSLSRSLSMIGAARSDSQASDKKAA